MSSLKEELISFDTAKLAKKKGFNELSNSCYNIIGVISNNINNKNEDWTNNEIYSAPTQSLLQKWLREAHKKEISITPVWSDETKTSTEYCPWVYYTKQEEELVDEEPEFYKTYEEALEKSLQEALKLI